MRDRQKPVPGYWFSNNANRLLWVRATTYLEGKLSLITFEDIKGERNHVSPDTWNNMQLILHSPVDSWQNTG